MVIALRKPRSRSTSIAGSQIYKYSLGGTCYEVRCPYLAIYISSSSYAKHACLDTINAVDVSASSAIFVSAGKLGEANIICYLNKTHGQFTAEACKATFTLLLSAKMAGKDVRFWFENDANPSCSKGNWGDLASHGVYHIRLES